MAVDYPMRCYASFEIDGAWFNGALSDQDRQAQKEALEWKVKKIIEQMTDDKSKSHVVRVRITSEEDSKK